MKALEDEVGRGAVAARSAMWRYTNLLNKNKFFLLGANVVEKTHLLQDFTTRKRAMQHFELEVHKKDLARDVYQRERELTAIQVCVPRATEITLIILKRMILCYVVLNI